MLSCKTISRIMQHDMNAMSKYSTKWKWPNKWVPKYHRHIDGEGTKNLWCLLENTVDTIKSIFKVPLQRSEIVWWTKPQPYFSYGDTARRAHRAHPKHNLFKSYTMLKMVVPSNDAIIANVCLNTFARSIACFSLFHIAMRYAYKFRLCHH